MSRLRITHTTTYRYTQPVSFGLHRLVTRPREGHDLLVESLLLEIYPGHTVSWHRDLFGNSVAMVRFLEEADYLEIRSTALIQRRDHLSHLGLLDLLPVRLPVKYSEYEKVVSGAYLAAFEPEEKNEIMQWAEREFEATPGMDAIQVMQRMNLWIFEHIKYKRRDDRGVQNPLQTLTLATGSCRDMATLLMEGMRCFGLAARFASGYLDNAAAAEGTASTHAWTEVYFPDHGWFGCDPTIGEATSLKHIVTGVSSHPRGVMPVSGTFVGNRSLTKGMTATVKIEKVGEGFKEELPPLGKVFE